MSEGFKESFGDFGRRSQITMNGSLSTSPHDPHILFRNVRCCISLEMSVTTTSTVTAVMAASGPAPTSSDHLATTAAAGDIHNDKDAEQHNRPSSGVPLPYPSEASSEPDGGDDGDDGDNGPDEGGHGR